MIKSKAPEGENKKDVPVLVNDDIAADAIADAIRTAPNGEAKISCLARDMVRELKSMGYVLAKSPGTPKPKGRAGK